VSKQNNVYRNLVIITSQYLGPAAERFIDRQVRNHLNKEPRDITKKDVEFLVDWLRSSVSLLTENEDLVEEYIDQVKTFPKGDKKLSLERD
jgi:hypothetical protein